MDLEERRQRREERTQRERKKRRFSFLLLLINFVLVAALYIVFLHLKGRPDARRSGGLEYSFKVHDLRQSGGYALLFHVGNISDSTQSLTGPVHCVFRELDKDGNVLSEKKELPGGEHAAGGRGGDGIVLPPGGTVRFRHFSEKTGERKEPVFEAEYFSGTNTVVLRR